MAKVKKGFAVAGQPDAAARKRAWQTRKARINHWREIAQGIKHD
jgi:hypothetical protein